MKKHAIIPVFMPHEGCPNDCVFCNQKKITARTKPLEKEAICCMVESYMKTIEGRGIETVEMAFFGGSFTGIPIETQRKYLEIARGYKDRGVIHKIRLSTRPDYINKEILDFLKEYKVDIIELGVQSMDDEVLRLSKRGHSSDHVYKASALIKEYGFVLGIQLMTGLPGDYTPKQVFQGQSIGDGSRLKSIWSAKKVADEIRPDIARIYPTMIIKETELADMFEEGSYKLWGLGESVQCVKEMVKILRAANVDVIRIGLKSTDNINNDEDVVGNNFHPAFRQLVEGEIAKEWLECYVVEISEKAGFSFRTVPTCCSEGQQTIVSYANDKSFSNLIGHKGVNKIYFREKYRNFQFVYKVDNHLSDNQFRCEIGG